MSVTRRPEKAKSAAPISTPAKEVNPRQSPRVQNLDLKLVNMFDAYEKQRTLIKDINESIDSTRNSDPKFVSPKGKTLISHQPSQFSKNTQPTRASVLEKAEINIGALTERFGEYRSNSKKLITEEDLTNKTDNQTPERARPSSTRSVKAFITPQIPDLKIQPFTVKAKRMSMIQGLFEDSRNKKLKAPSLSHRGEERTLSLEPSNTGYKLPLSKNLIEQTKYSASANPSRNELSHETAPPADEKPQIKFSAFRKTLRTQEVSRRSLRLEEIKMLNPSTSRKRLDSQNSCEEMNLLPKSARGDSQTRSEFRIKSNVAAVVSSLKPNKVTTEQKGRLTKFLSNDFVDEVISNKHHIKDFYDGEAVSNLNELKKIMTSHTAVRNTIYERASVQRKHANGNQNSSTNNVPEEFPLDMPRLKKFELSEPEGDMLGIRPKCILGQRSSRDETKNEEVKALQDDSLVQDDSEHIQQELDNKRASLANLNKAADFQRGKYMKLRMLLKNKLLKYASQGICLQDVSFLFNFIVNVSSWSAEQIYSQQNRTRGKVHINL